MARAVAGESRTALAALDGVEQQGAILWEDGRQGQFVYDASDLSAEVAADQTQAIYIPPVSDISGASGAWVRQYSGSPDVRWFGADPTGVDEADTAFESIGSRVTIPEGSYKLNATVNLAGAMSWRKDPMASFTGAGSFYTPDIQGYNYNPDVRYISLVESRGTPGSPTTDKHPAAAIVKHSNVPDPGDGSSVAALYVANSKWSNTPYSRVQAGYFEARERIGGVNTFIEGIRSHAINGLAGGVGGDVYGAILYAQSGEGANDPGNMYVIGCETEINRLNGTDAPLPQLWTSADKLDCGFSATINSGPKASAGYMLNPYSQGTARIGFLVPNSAAAQGVTANIVDFAAFATVEDGVTFGLYVKGTTWACIGVPNDAVIIRARNAADNNDLAILSLDTSNILQVGAQAAGTRVNGAVYLDTGALVNAANDAAAAAGGVPVGRLYRNGSVLMIRIA